MKSVYAILNKVLVKEFYRSNASFFLVVIGLGAGFMRSAEHIALAEFFVSSPLVLLIPIIIWVLYAIKVTGFNLDLLRGNENEFLFCIPLLPVKEQWISLLQAVSAQLAPMVLYGIFLIAVAIKNGITHIAIWICVAFTVIIIGSVIRLIHALNHPNVEKDIWAVTRYLNAKLVKPYFLFFPEWILRRQPLMVIGTKLFSGLLLLGVSELYKYDRYDLRLFGMGTILAFSANINLMWELHRFDNVHLSILRNLPIPFFKRVSYFMVTTILLLIPEIVIITKNFPIGFDAIELLSVVLFGISIAVLFYGCLYLKDMGQDQMMTLVFFIAMALIVITLFQVPVFVLAFVNLCAGFWIWKIRYYSFEQIAR